MPSTSLKVIRAADDQDQPAAGETGPLFRGNGDQDYLCGNCGAVIIEGFSPTQHVSVENAECSTCGTTNEFPPDLRSRHHLAETKRGRMEDGETVAHVAADMIRRYGADTPSICRQNAEADDERRDFLSAETWYDIAGEAERQLRPTP